MRFLPTVDLWNSATHTAVSSGQLKLIPGQWCQCGQGPKCRFVCVRKGGSIWVIHADGTGGITRKRFSQAVKSWTK